MGITLCGKKISPNKYKYFIPEDGMSPLFLGAVVRVEDMEGGQDPSGWSLRNARHTGDSRSMILLSAQEEAASLQVRQCGEGLG